MKPSTSLIVTGASLAFAQDKSTRAPMMIYKINAGQTTECSDLGKTTVDLQRDAITIKLGQFYAEAGAQGKKDVNGDLVQDFGYCVMDWGIERHWQDTSAWRFRLTNTTYTGSAKAKGGATIVNFQTDNPMEWTRAEIDGVTKNILSKQVRVNTMQRYEPDPQLGVDGDYDSTFRVTASPSWAAEEWSPCLGPLPVDKADFLQWRLIHNVRPREPEGVTAEDPTKWFGAIGKPLGESDIVIRMGIEWEQCDPAKFPFESWGTPASAASDEEGKM